jgi:antitoxin ParD1/3/4
MRAALRALDREEAAVDEWLRQKIDEAFADPEPNIPAREVVKRLRAYRAERRKSSRREKV